MITITMPIEDYNELKAKADAYDAQQSTAKVIFNLFETQKPRDKE